LVRILVVGLATIVLAASLAYADPPPEEVWNVIYNDPWPWDEACDVAADDAGFIYVTGFGIDGQPAYFRTIKYNPDGNVEWNKIYTQGSDYIIWAFGVDVDTAGYVYVAGFQSLRDGSWQIDGDPNNGNAIWTKTYDQDHDIATGVAVDEAGFIYVTGYSGPQELPHHEPPVNGPHDFCTVKYNSEGDRLWVKEYNSGWDDRAFGVAVDGDGNIYVTGSQYRSATGYDYLTIKYDPDGNEIWKSSYISFDDDWASDIAVSKDGNIYVTGWSGSEEDGYDYLTVKIDSGGNRVWNETYGKNVSDKAQSIAVDDAGCIYVTGWSYSGNEFGYLTVKYDPEGNVCWKKVFDAEYSEDRANGVAVDKQGHIYVTGFSDGAFRTIKYRQILGIDEDIPVRVDPTLSLDAVPGGLVIIRYQLTSSRRVSLSIYDALGRKVAILVDAQKPAGEHEYSWTPDGAGVYFIRLQAGGSQTTRKFVSLR
jgi:hypothetical protein